MRLLECVSKDLMLGRTVLVTGGGSGINLAIAKSFAEVGANLALCGRTRSRLDGAATQLRELGAKVSVTVADVRDPEAVEAAFDRSADELGPVDTVIAGAAGNFFAPAAAMSANGFRTVIEIDLLGSFHTAHAAFGQLKQTHGNLIFVSAGQSYLPFAHQAHVGAAKAGIDNLMRNLALEWGKYGIRSNSIVPGPIAGTEGMDRLTGPTGKDVWTGSVPLGRFGAADEVAAMAVVLASPLAAYVTGAQIIVDGGLSLSGLGSLSQAVVDSMTVHER